MNNLECFIDFDDEWIQEDCHWKYDRIFTITWKITGVSNITSKELYYRIGTYSENWKDYIQITTPTEKPVGNDTKSWSYNLRLSSIAINTLLAARSDEGWLPITAYLKVKDSSGTVNTAYYTYNYYLELSPKPVENSIRLTPEIYTPGELKCSWEAATTQNNNEADSVNGYTVEMKRCLAGNDYTKDENYSYVGNLAWDEVELGKGRYKLKLTEDIRDLTIPEAAGITTFVNTVINTEVYIDGADNNYFYFEPKQLGFEKGDYYKFIIYPHSHYSSEHTLIAPDGTESEAREVPNGIFHVFNGTNWVEGVVYIMTGKGWEIADSIYVMTEDENGNKIWKETT